MIKRLRVSSIWSEALNKLLPFYRDLLGLPVSLETPGFVVLGEPDTPAVALGTHSEVRGRGSDPARHIVGLETGDIAKECRRLREAGLEFVEDPKDVGNGWVATFKDPEGNLLQLLQFHPC